MSFDQFRNKTNNRLLFGLFLFTKLPSAWISGVRVRQLNEQRSVVSVPYTWLSQNPFKSTYFACQAMAAEMSTGLLAMGHLHGRKPQVSMLVTKLQAQYFKKAVSRTFFTCEDGDAIAAAIRLAAETGEGQTVTATSIGKNKAGETISRFDIEWSFKAKKS